MLGGFPWVPHNAYHSRHSQTHWISSSCAVDAIQLEGKLPSRAGHVFHLEIWGGARLEVEVGANVKNHQWSASGCVVLSKSWTKQL